jgi:Transposase IS66 family/IstB-like ATP binding protein
VKRQHEPQKVVGDLLSAELSEKQARSIKYQMMIAKMPFVKDVDAFDFEAVPINQTLVRDLAGGAFLLRLFLDDGRIEIDTNVVERAIRPIALNRKNALFAGSDQGGVHWGVIASLIETCLCRARHRPANSTPSIPRPTSPTSSAASSTAIPPARSTSSCPGPTPTKWPEDSAYYGC